VFISVDCSLTSVGNSNNQRSGDSRYLQDEPLSSSIDSYLSFLIPLSAFIPLSFFIPSPFFLPPSSHLPLYLHIFFTLYLHTPHFALVTVLFVYHQPILLGQSIFYVIRLLPISLRLLPQHVCKKFCKSSSMSDLRTLFPGFSITIFHPLLHDFYRRDGLGALTSYQVFQLSEPLHLINLIPQYLVI
jgi:hypothetical protein